MTEPVAVTGSTGKLGSRVARRLSETGVKQLLVGRDPSRLPTLPGAERRGPATYLDGTAMATALDGARTLFLVSARLSGQRLEEHSAAVRAAQAVGVEHVVYTSLLGAAPDATYVNARDHWDTEQFLQRAGLPYTILRCGFYASMLPGLADEFGVIRGPAGDGKVSAVSHDDIADVAANILSAADSSEHYGQTYEVTGPEALDLSQVAARLTQAMTTTFSYADQTVADAYATRAELSASRSQVEGWVSWYQAIQAGEVERVTDVVRHVGGHGATSVEDAVRDNPDVSYGRASVDEPSRS